MELTQWQSERVEKSLAFISQQRMERTGIIPEIIDIQVPDDTPKKSIAIKANNAIFDISARSPNFVVVLYINQYNRDGLLQELLDALLPRDYSKIFFVDELIVNPIDNKMVPKHELCSNKAVTKLLHKYSITIDALPKILLRDPIVRWYGWEVGDIIKVTRPKGELYYRMVVDRTF